jgi:hypothetical protein
MKTIGTGNEAPDDMDFTDPTRKYKTLEFSEDPNCDLFYYGVEQELCWSCGWNTRNQRFSSYGSRLRVIHTRENSGIWTLGTRWILRDQPNDRFLGNNYMTLKFLHKQPNLTIPLPKEIRTLSESTDSIYLTLESRVSGDTLMLVWPALNQEEKASYSHQLANAIRQLRQFTAPRPQKVDGSQLDDNIIGACFKSGPGNCFKIPYNVEEWLDGLGPDLRMGLSRFHDTTDPVIIEEKFQELKACFPDCGPYVLTHGDLNFSNIIVKDGKIQGIIDWERAGYYPWWMERRASYMIPSNDANELFDPIWEELMPELDCKKWAELIEDKMFPAERAFGHCSHTHPGDVTCWWKPSFCESRDIQGDFRAFAWGMPISCQIDQISTEQEALLKGYKRKDPWASKTEKESEAP